MSPFTLIRRPLTREAFANRAGIPFNTTKRLESGTLSTVPKSMAPAVARLYDQGTLDRDALEEGLLFAQPLFTVDVPGLNIKDRHTAHYSKSGADGISADGHGYLHAAPTATRQRKELHKLPVNGFNFWTGAPIFKVEHQANLSELFKKVFPTHSTANLYSYNSATSYPQTPVMPMRQRLLALDVMLRNSYETWRYYERYLLSPYLRNLAPQANFTDLRLTVSRMHAADNPSRQRTTDPTSMNYFAQLLKVAPRSVEAAEANGTIGDELVNALRDAQFPFVDLLRRNSKK